MQVYIGTRIFVQNVSIRTFPIEILSSKIQELLILSGQMHEVDKSELYPHEG
jgi:hypothetical protein